MNQKAQRQQIEFPPLLNLQEDRPRIATDFKSVEHINAPYINGMMTPLWKKEENYVNKPVWDYKNNKYEVINGYLTKNGEDLFAVDNYHFKKEDVTEEYSKYLAFNFSNSGDLAHLDWTAESNTLDFYYKNYHLSKTTLFTNGILLAARVRVFDENTAIAVIVYEIENQLYMLYMNTAYNIVRVEQITWCSFIPKTSTDQTMSSRVSTISIPQVSPIIYIAKPQSGIYAISLISNKNIILYTRTEGYFTFVDRGPGASENRYMSGPNWVSTDGAGTETITSYYISNFLFSHQYITQNSLIDCIQKSDEKWYYLNDPNTLVPNQDNNPYFYPSSTSRIVEIGGVEYRVYVQNQYTNTFKAIISCDNLYNKTANISITLSDSGDKLSGILTSSGPLELTKTTVDYYKRKQEYQSATITFFGQTYNVTDFTRQYSITRTETANKSAPYLNCPQVFLDNGNLYSFYTIPEAAADSWPIALPDTAFLVESGKLTGFIGHKYTFSILEAHLTQPYANIGRSNSIGCGQNFWTSNTKLSSTGVRKPSELYSISSPLAEIAPSVGHSYTDYTNSNCSDMLYYAGNVYAIDMPFYKNAPAGSEDYAWYNPGGFRTSIQNNSKWNILYYVDEDTVAMQGISYSKDENEMGTLLTPFASLSIDNYIACADDFVVYFDKNNHIYKISIEEGAELRQIFDNKYILVNTTSYWNLWDEEHNRKFHYATDYNNRIKIGYDRKKYRDTVANYFTERNVKKFASCINYNYNTVPRYPVSSMLPVIYSLFHTLTERDVSPYIKAYGCEYDEAREVQAIEVYFQWGFISNTQAKYLASIKVFPNGQNIFKDTSLSGMIYSSTSSIRFPICLFTTFINGAGNNDFAVEDYSKYPLIYNNQSQPTLMYNYAGGSSVENAKWFFVIQGQYYAVIGEKLYAMIYSSGVISQMDAIVDLGDMKYVGNTPAIAFFVNPYTKQVYSFTGDANLQQIFDASKYTFKWNDKKPDELSHWYDEATQSIYISTEQGLLVFGPQNTYCLEDFKNVSDIEFVDGNIHIVEDKIITLRYYHDVEDFEDLPIYMETSFWGLGADESTSIDRWQITLYDPEHREQDIKLQVRSLTDVSTQAEEKKLHVNSNDWDKWSHSVLLSFSPKLIKGQGIRLSIKTDSAIQKIVPHIMDNKTSTPTNSRFQA